MRDKPILMTASNRRVIWNPHVLEVVVVLSNPIISGNYLPSLGVMNFTEWKNKAWEEWHSVQNGFVFSTNQTPGPLLQFLHMVPRFRNYRPKVPGAHVPGVVAVLSNSIISRNYSPSFRIIK